ncbi:MAG: adenosylhomocysteinase, partial [Candidatus Hodarchaeales archaeon]
ISFSLQALATEYIVKNREKIAEIGGNVLQIPEEIDDNVAFMKCESLDIELDDLTPEQEKYLSSWRVGT